MIAKRTVKNFNTCEYCRVKPCFFLAKGEVEYGDHCRHFKADSIKVKFAKSINAN